MCGCGSARHPSAHIRRTAGRGEARPAVGIHRARTVKPDVGARSTVLAGIAGRRAVVAQAWRRPLPHVLQHHEAGRGKLGKTIARTAHGAWIAGHRLFADGDRGLLSILQEPAFHLEVNIRSFRANRLSEWVDAVLRGDAAQAANIIVDLKDFPLVLTRSLPTARAWLSARARGLRGCGLVASSGATRLRAEGLELSSGFRQGNRDLYVHWFLAEPTDVRSSNQLEIVASEFECQGLELDWVGVCWGGNFTFDRNEKTWAFRNFSGNSWRNVGREIGKRYLLNTYRVLLTRAREGLIIWISTGDDNDPTRASAPLDATADYLKACGVPAI